MVRIEGKYLHFESKQTRKMIPYDKNIGPNTYPEQNLEYLNTEIKINIHDERLIDEFIEPYEEPTIKTRIFTCIRWDLEEPHRKVFVSKEYEYMISTLEDIVVEDELDQDDNPTGYKILDRTLNYPIQERNLIGNIGTIHYGYILNDRILENDEEPLSGIVLFSSQIEPTNDIIITTGEETYKVFDIEEIWFKLDEEQIEPDVPENEWTITVRQEYLEGRTPYGAS